MLAKLIVALYILLPITLLTTHSIPSAVFYALIAASLVLLIVDRFSNFARQTRNYAWLLCSYSGLFWVVTASSWYHGEWAGANSEGALRFLVGLWLLLAALPNIKQQYLKTPIYGVYAAAAIATAVLLWLVITSEHKPTTPILIIVTYTSLTLLLGVITTYSLNWHLTPWPTSERIAKILLTLGVFAVFLAAQTRTGLLGTPVFVFLAIVLFVRFKNPFQIGGLFILAVAILVTVVGSSQVMRNRIAEGISEVQACQGEQSTQSSSMCIRLQMWRSAIDAGLNHPLVGLGDAGKFNDYLRTVALPKGWTTQFVVDNFGEPHNDLLSIFVGFGFPGVVALLLIYLAPCIYFWPRLLDTKAPPQARSAAAMGLAICLGFLFFGLTETMFRRMNTIGFYTAMVAWFIVLSDPRPSRQEAPVQSPRS